MSTKRGSLHTVLAANPLRKYARISNTSNTVIVYVMLGAGAVFLGGIQLGPFGFFEINKDNLFTGLVSATVDPAGSDGKVAVLEAV